MLIKILGSSTKSEDVNGPGKQTFEKCCVKIVNTNQSSVSKLNTEENSQKKLINRETKRVTSLDCKPNSFDDVLLDKTKSDEKKSETEYKKVIKDNRSMHQTSQEISTAYKRELGHIPKWTMKELWMPHLWQWQTMLNMNNQQYGKIISETQTQQT